MSNLSLEWENFNTNYSSIINTNYNYENKEKKQNIITPKCSELYISTKTKIAHLNKPINLYKSFWEFPITPYYIPKEGVLQKIMKFNSTKKEELEIIENNLKNINNSNTYIISHIDNPNGRKIKFKDVRKIIIGYSSKDFISYRKKPKSAFYNCFAIILRIKIKSVFKEIHIKIFNTGKLEIPGIREESELIYVLKFIVKLFKSINIDIEYVGTSIETVLINSNFTCNYYINRSKLAFTLESKALIRLVLASIVVVFPRT